MVRVLLVSLLVNGIFSRDGKAVAHYGREPASRTCGGRRSPAGGELHLALQNGERRIWRRRSLPGRHGSRAAAVCLLSCQSSSDCTRAAASIEVPRASFYGPRDSGDPL